jgi:hypothetical protein
MKNGTIYFRDGDLIAKSREVRVYKMDEELFMGSNRGNLISADQDLSEYIWQINNKPFGNCLVVGLGLGVATRYILSLTNVDKVTVVEENKDVITAQAEVGYIDDNRLTVINKKYLQFLYKTKEKYDFIFIDCYNKIDEDTFPMIADIAAAGKLVLTNEGILIGWLDNSTPEIFIDAFYGLFTLN